MRLPSSIGIIKSFGKFSKIVSLLMLLTTPDFAWALSDAEYKAFMKTSPAFAAAEARLKSAWDTAKKVLPEIEFADLQKNQKGWTTHTRDFHADSLMRGKGTSRSEAYAQITIERAKLIEEYNKPERRTPQTKTGFLRAPYRDADGFLDAEDGAFFFDESARGKILAVCNYGDTCRITGVLNIDDCFLSIADAKLVAQNESVASGKVLTVAPSGQPSAPHVAATSQTTQGQAAEKSQPTQAQKTDTPGPSSTAAQFFPLLFLVLAIAAAILARRKKRSALGWFVLTLFIFPAILILLFLKGKQEASMTKKPIENVYAHDSQEQNIINKLLDEINSDNPDICKIIEELPSKYSISANDVGKYISKIFSDFLIEVICLPREKLSCVQVSAILKAVDDYNLKSDEVTVQLSKVVVYGTLFDAYTNPRNFFKNTFEAIEAEERSRRAP